MRSVLGLGILMFALSFCNLGERMQQLQGTDDAKTDGTGTTKDNGSGDVEEAEMTAAQKAIADGGSTVEWEGQGISWQLPSGWPKMDVRKESFNYGSPASGFLIGTISSMSPDFPSETSLKATYESSLEQLRQGKYESARWLEIDGVKGVEFVEAVPEDKDGIRRFQWIAFRNFQGQNQQLNIMLSTKQSNFEKQRDTFAAIMYSMKIAKG
ncbi:MAG TPA: hypothetical protein PKD24_15035 [Pyrinomonadaceae bacterium]|nr:hypothetical protein [Pyrinomonadaceae bacterium]HMP66772.1 hypothetical protein [Pyrinomonadaceae bacterium]